MPESTVARVRNIICEHLCVPADEVGNDTILSDLGADSIDRVEISMAIEDEFKVKITDEVADANITFDSTLGTIAAFVDTLEHQ